MERAVVVLDMTSGKRLMLKRSRESLNPYGKERLTTAQSKGYYQADQFALVNVGLHAVAP